MEAFDGTPAGGVPDVSSTETLPVSDEASRAMEEIAEPERSGGFIPELGLGINPLVHSTRAFVPSFPPSYVVKGARWYRIFVKKYLFFRFY
jgi:hypothetical protein